MRPQRLAELKEAEDLLIRGFPVFVAAFARTPAFNKPAQLTTHLKTIAIRQELGSAQAALHDAKFVAALYETLRAWGIGSRGSRLLDVREFRVSLERNEAEIHALESKSLGSETVDIDDVSARVWRLIKSASAFELKATRAGLSTEDCWCHSLQ